MLTALKFLYSLSLAFWIGSIFFLSMIAAPSVFKVLSREQAGNVVSDIFPKYYLVSYACAIIAIISSGILISLSSTFSSTNSIIKMGGLFIMLGLAIYAGEINRPEVHAARTEMRAAKEGSPEYEKIHNKFRKLHQVSAITNGVIFILGIALVFLSAYTNRE